MSQNKERFGPSSSVYSKLVWGLSYLKKEKRNISSKLPCALITLLLLSLLPFACAYVFL